MSDGRGKYTVAGTEPEEPKGCAASFSNFIYNSNKGTIMGRTCSSWAKILIFYIIYYACLAAFFIGMISVFLYGIIVEDMPHLTGKHSLLGLNPGMGFRPQPDPLTTLITFTAGKPDTYEPYVANLQKLYDEYKDIAVGNMRANGSCKPDSLPDNEPTKVCPFNWDLHFNKGCVPGNKFGYDVGEPCVMLKMNRIFGWLPNPINDSVPHPLVECHGENAADAETIGPITYIPSISVNGKSYGYFSQAYFPFLHQAQYQSPLIAVQLNKLIPNVMVMVECRLHNLQDSTYSKMDKEAMARFEIKMIK